MASSKVRIRCYNVGFGDCFLITFKEASKKRHILIDFGNAPGKGGSNELFGPIAKDIQNETGGKLDVIIMTHEHLDHMEGFYAQRKIFDALDVDQVWMSLPSHPDYYDDYPNAKKHKTLKELSAAFSQHLMKNKNITLAPSFVSLLLNNLSNQDRIDYLIGLSKNPVKYLSRGSTILGKPSSKNVKFRILAPEKDVSVYYSDGQHHLNMMTTALNTFDDTDNHLYFPGMPRIKTPPNLSAYDWEQLRGTIQTGTLGAIRSIDKAQNNTSLVFLLEIDKKRLMFTGDAEIESWEFMKKKCNKYLKPVHFLKVSHHGSRNGTPQDILSKLLPKNNKNNAVAMLSTKRDVYGTKNPVPDESLIKEIKNRCKEFVSTHETKKEWVDLEV
jgi:beta-lactamase superfamily II metal-dependent hydrolase